MVALIASVGFLWLTAAPHAAGMPAEPKANPKVEPKKDEPVDSKVASKKEEPAEPVIGTRPLSVWKQSLTLRQAEARAQAAVALGGYGAKAAPAAPLLVAALSDREILVRMSAAKSLGEIGPSAAEVSLPALRKLVADPNEGMRYVAVRALGQLGPSAKSAADELLSALADPDTSVREAAAESLAALGPVGTEILVAGLAAPDADRRRQSAHALGRVAAGKRPEPMLPGQGPDEVGSLCSALADRDAAVRAAAAGALGQLGTRAKPALGKLVQRIGDEAPEVRIAALGALGRFGADARPMTDNIVPGLADKEPTVRRAAVAALARIGGGPAATALTTLLADPDMTLAAHATTALRGMAGDAVPALTVALGHGDPKVRRIAAATLGGIGKPAQLAAPALRHLLTDTDPDVRRAAEAALKAIAPPGGP